MRHLAAALCLLSAPAFAQSNPSFITGQIPTAAQWNSYFGKKADVTGGTINNGVLNSVTINGSLGGSPTVGGVWTASNATLSGFAISGGSLAGTIAGAGATITGFTNSGGTLTGTIAGSPTLSGTWTFQGNLTVRSTGTCPASVNGGGSVNFTSTVTNCQIAITAPAGTGNVLLQAPAPAASSGWLALNGTLSLKQNVVYTSGSGIAPGGLSPASFWLDVGMSGTNNIGSGNPWFARLRDTVVESANAGSAQPFAFDHEYNAGADGTRNSFQITLNKNAPSVSGSQAFNALQVFSHILSGEGGTGPSTYQGVVWAFNPDISVQTGADYYELVHNTEFDLRVYAGNHVDAKVIGDFHYGTLDAVHGASGNDTAIGISASPTIAPGTGAGLQGVMFGQYNQAWPIDPNASGTALISVQPNITHNLTYAWQPYAAFGIDLSYVNCGVACWRSPGIQIDGNGQMSILGPGSITYSANTLTLDAPNVVEVSAVVVATGDNGFKVGDELKDTIGGLWSVATITPGVQTVTLLRPGYATSCPASPTATTGGGGTGPQTLTITCSVATKGLKIAGASTALGFYNATPIVKATPAGACAGNTGCQALRDALGNLGLINTGSITN